MKVERLEDVNDDLLVVNAARVSFGKWKDEFEDSDVKLLHFLAEHDHWTPFGHPIFCFVHEFRSAWEAFTYTYANAGPGVKFWWDEYRTDRVSMSIRVYESVSLYGVMNRKNIPAQMFNTVMKKCPHSGAALIKDQDAGAPGWGIGLIADADVPAPLQTARFRIKIPIFVAREWFRHTKGFVRNEISRRYVDDLPDCWLPDSYRVRHTSKKQGSAKEAPENNMELVKSAHIMTTIVTEFYETLLKNNVAPEMARHILPQSMYTEFIETAYVEDYERLLGLRLQPDAQKEIQIVAEMLKEQL